MTADPAEIRRALAVLLEPESVAELRVLYAGRDGTVSGYFSDHDALAREAARWSGQAPGVYITLNPVVPALLARAANRARTRAEQTTSDRDILRRRWLPIDLDPVRPSGISATEAEHEVALVAAQVVRDDLHAAGWPAPFYADSGNGAHLLYRVVLANDAASTTLLSRCLQALALRFDDDAVRVDLKTFNPARIWKVYGTLAAKGDATADRPHRLARLLEVPRQVAVVSGKQLADLAATMPEAPTDPGRNGHGSGLDLTAWLTRHAERLRVVGRGPWNGGDRWILNPCPWDAGHANRAAFIVRFASGAIAAGCHHNGCAGRDWPALRDLVEPGWQEWRRPREASGQREARADLWTRAQPAPEFLCVSEAELDFLEARLLARGSITEWFSPRGLGKTHVAHALMVRHALAGRRVLLIDRDNSRREVRRRLREWGAGGASTLRVLTRDHAPALTDKATWAVFPFGEYDLVVIDSLDAATEGVGEQDSARPATALAPILDIAHREAGPAILVLGNTIKSGAHGRGSGVVEDRADITYEVRDATALLASGSKPWWLELPPAGREAWGERAARRRRRDRYRLAFVPSKFRIGEEPDPFVFEIDLSTEPWQLRDVTADLEAAGQAARGAAEAERLATRERAMAAVLSELARRTAARESPLGKRAAEAILTEAGVSRKVARELLSSEPRWRLVPDPDDDRKTIVAPMRPEPGHPPTVVDPAVSAASGTAPQTDTSDTPNAARRVQSGRPHLASAVPALDAAIVNPPQCGRPGNIPPASDPGRIVYAVEVSAPVDGPERAPSVQWEEV